jgi:hypothetical protein
MALFAVRCVYFVGVKPDGLTVFEERVVAFEAESREAAAAKGDAESDAYAAENGYVAFPELSCYDLDDGAASDGAEVWSELYEDSCSLAEFYAKRYSSVEYHATDVRPPSCPK